MRLEKRKLIREDDWYVGSVYLELLKDLCAKSRFECGSKKENSFERMIGMSEVFIWNFLKKKGLSDWGTAGLMGNLYAESGLKPTNLRN